MYLLLYTFRSECQALKLDIVRRSFLILNGFWVCRVNLSVQVNKCRLSISVKTVGTQGDCLNLVFEYTVSIYNVLKPTGADQLVYSTLEKGLTNHLGPSNQMSSEFLICITSLAHLVKDDALLYGCCRVLLLNGNCKTLQERFVQQLSADEFTII